MKLRPRAEVFCFKNGKVLCHWASGYTVFPGGGIDVNESAMQAAKREAMEEADRVVLNCMAAHEPTVQMWAEGYAAKNKWAKGHTGGLTYWMVGTTSEKPFTPEVNAKERHKDYEKDYAWHEIPEVLKQLKTETDGDWKDDVAVRIGILENQVKLEEPLKAAQQLRLPVTAMKLG
jgi:8-oxo-dGTP pyrophosphatase MutT (NUDIX family)